MYTALRMQNMRSIPHRNVTVALGVGSFSLAVNFFCVFDYILDEDDAEPNIDSTSPIF